jgi:hypothetical protein
MMNENKKEFIASIATIIHISVSLCFEQLLLEGYQRALRGLFLHLKTV